MNQRHKPCPMCGQRHPRVREVPAQHGYGFVVRCDMCQLQTGVRDDPVMVWEDWDRRCASETEVEHVHDYRKSLDGGTYVCSCGAWK